MFIIQTGQLIRLSIAKLTSYGAYLDASNIDARLFLPKKEIPEGVSSGDELLIYVYTDANGQIQCSANIYSHLRADAPYQKNDHVTGTVYRIHPELGIFVAVDDLYMGLIPPNEYFRDVKHGEKLEARVIRIREDGKLDLSLRNLAYQQMSIDAEKLIHIMQNNNGVLPLNEKAAPEEIAHWLNMSKAAFKRAVGSLLKSKRIIKNGDQLELIPSGNRARPC